MKKYAISTLTDILYIFISLTLTLIAHIMLEIIANFTLKPFISRNEEAYKLIIAIISLLLFSMLLVYFKHRIKSKKTKLDISILFFIPILALINAFLNSPITVLIKPIFMLEVILESKIAAYLISISVSLITYYTYLLIYNIRLENKF